MEQEPGLPGSRCGVVVEQAEGLPVLPLLLPCLRDRGRAGHRPWRAAHRCPKLGCLTPPSCRQAPPRQVCAGAVLESQPCGAVASAALGWPQDPAGAAAAFPGSACPCLTLPVPSPATTLRSGGSPRGWPPAHAFEVSRKDDRCGDTWLRLARVSPWRPPPACLHLTPSQAACLSPGPVSKFDAPSR